MIIRPAISTDAESACDVVRRSITQLCQADHQNDEATLAAWLANKTPDNFRNWFTRHPSFVAHEGSIILGVGMMTSAGEIIINYVSPAARFRGVSKALIAAMESDALVRCLEKVNLLSSETAHRFYLTLGYTDIGQPEPGVGVTISYPMTKKLGT